MFLVIILRPELLTAFTFARLTMMARVIVEGIPEDLWSWLMNIMQEGEVKHCIEIQVGYAVIL